MDYKLDQSFQFVKYFFHIPATLAKLTFSGDLYEVKKEFIYGIDRLPK